MSRFGSDGSLATLTEKQRAVLDLLIQHKTSKEISRDLGISPHTVDQRIDLVKSKWNLGSRSELAQVYRKAVEAERPTSERMTYEESPVGEPVAETDESGRNESAAVSAPVAPERTDQADPDAQVKDYRVVPELFEGRWGTLARLGAIVLIALLLLLALLAGLSVFVTVTEVYAK